MGWVEKQQTMPIWLKGTLTLYYRAALDLLDYLIPRASPEHSYFTLLSNLPKMTRVSDLQPFLLSLLPFKVPVNKPKKKKRKRAPRRTESRICDSFSLLFSFMLSLFLPLSCPYPVLIVISDPLSFMTKKRKHRWWRI